MQFILSFRLCLIGALLVSFSSAIATEDGPVVPCEGCPNFETSPLPETGIWYNPNRSGTGFMLEVQDRRVAGYYYLYSEDGDPEWLLFTSELQSVDDPDIKWLLEADLERVAGGSCLSCAYEAPSSVEVVGQIRFEFLQRNLARFQVGNGNFQNIWTLPFGWNVSPAFQPRTDYLIPELEGFWSISVLDEQGMLYSRGFEFVNSSDSNLGLDVIISALNRSPSIPEPLPPEQVGALQCGSLDNIEGPICKLSLDDFSEQTFVFPIGNLGGSQIHGESSNGWVLHANRIDVD